MATEVVAIFIHEHALPPHRTDYTLWEFPSTHMPVQPGHSGDFGRDILYMCSVTASTEKHYKWCVYPSTGKDLSIQVFVAVSWARLCEIAYSILETLN